MKGLHLKCPSATRLKFKLLIDSLVSTKSWCQLPLYSRWDRRVPAEHRGFGFELPGAAISIHGSCWGVRCGEIAVVKTFQLKLASPESSEPQGPWTAALRQPSQVRQRCDEEVSIERLYVAWWRRLAGHVHQNTWYIQSRSQYLIMFVISKDPLTLFESIWYCV